MQAVIAKHEEVVYSKYELVRVTNHDRVSSIVGKHALLNHWHEELEITYRRQRHLLHRRAAHSGGTGEADCDQFGKCSQYCAG